VSWTYDHEALIEAASAAQIDEVVASFQHRNPKRSKYNDFLLTGILEAADGSRFHGEPAKSGANNYYVNKTLKMRCRCQRFDDAVVARLRQYLDEAGTLQRVFERTLAGGQTGESPVRAERSRLQARVRELTGVVEGFSRGLRELALAGAGGRQLAEATQSLLEERKRAEAERQDCEDRLSALAANERQLTANLQGQTLRVFLKKMFERLDSLPAGEKKRVVQAIVHKVIVHNKDRIEIQVFVDPGSQERLKLEGRRKGFAGIFL
jgi:hypothetical protein